MLRAVLVMAMISAIATITITMITAVVALDMGILLTLGPHSLPLFERFKHAIPRIAE